MKDYKGKQEEDYGSKKIKCRDVTGNISTNIKDNGYLNYRNL
jgi:hypothetical protein